MLLNDTAKFHRQSQRAYPWQDNRIDMQEYPIKRGFTKGMEERMIEGLETYFGVKPEEKDGHYFIASGSFSRLETFVSGKKFVVDTESDSDLYSRMEEAKADEIVLKTNKQFRAYLEFVTGYNTKERKKKAEQEAKKAGK